MNNLLNYNFRKELLRTDVIPKKLNEVSQRYKDLFLEDLKNKVIKIETVEVCQCGSKNLEELTKIDRFGLPFGSLICKECGLVVTSPIISKESLPYYYDKYYHPLNYGKEHLEDQSALFAIGQGKKIFSILKDFLPQKEKITVLEVGAGTGNVLFEFKEEAKKENILVEELGTEYSQDCILKCQDRNINIIYGDIQTVLEHNKKFDIIILSHVFEHFIDLNKELSDLKKLMTDDTLLYVEVPGILVNHKKHYYGFSFLGYLIHAHMYNFTMKSLNNILVINGFEMIYGNEEIESICRLTSTPPKRTENSYHEIIQYLEFLDINNNYFLEQYRSLNDLKKQTWKQESDIEKQKEMIEYRNKEIDKQKEMIEYRNKEIDKQKQKIVDMQKVLNHTKQTLQHIHNSRGYKILQKYYKIKSIIKGI